MRQVIFTDVQNASWLQYILEEFVHIQKANFSFDIRQYHEGNALDPAAIYYTKRPTQGNHWLKNKSTDIDGDRIHYESDVFYLSESIYQDKTLPMGFDLLWNAFYFLSRFEEYQHELKGHFIRSNSFNHPRKNKSSFLIPVVNVYFNRFQNYLKSINSALSFQEPIKPKVLLSHDLDYISKTWQLRLKQGAFNGFNAIRSILSPKRFLNKFSKSMSFAFGKSDYWRFDYWEAIDQSVKCQSIFNIYAGVKNRGLKNLMIDPSYNIHQNKLLQKALKNLISKGFEIGLHGSFKSACSFEILQAEKERLSAALQVPITKSRQHWLNYEELKTPYIHEKLFKVDSSIGWNDQIGFRAGTCSMYRPYDHKNQKPFEFLIIPQIIMDANIYDYNFHRQEEVFQNGFTMLQKLNLYPSSHVSISWHPRTVDSDYNWHLGYEKYIKSIQEWDYQ